MVAFCDFAVFNKWWGPTAIKNGNGAGAPQGIIFHKTGRKIHRRGFDALK